MTDRYINQVIEYTASGVELIRDKIDSGRCGSPIERGFLTGLVGRWLLNRAWSFAGLYTMPVETEFSAVVHLQHPANGYRLDFAIHLTWNGYGKTESEWIAVECDGHDFHERTKEQAAHDRKRDRALTAAGMKLFRFTGSEIYRDVVQCTLEVESYIFGRVAEWRAMHSPEHGE